jgi:hypothetical protein
MKRRKQRKSYSFGCNWTCAVLGIFTLFFVFISLLAARSLQYNRAAAVIPENPAGIYRESTTKYHPPTLRSLIVNPNSQTNYFDFLLDTGDISFSDEIELKPKAKDLINYFFLGITLPPDEFWVNLNPIQPDKIVSPRLGITDTGRVLLEADLQLKKDSARFTNPRTSIGKEYWQELSKRLQEKGLNTTQVPASTRVWIVPGKTKIREQEDKTTILSARLRVCLESEYLSHQNNNFTTNPNQTIEDCSSQSFKEIILPKLEQEVNFGKNYAKLRQVYTALILSECYKRKYWGKNNFYSQSIHQARLVGLCSKEDWKKDKFFQAYLNSHKQGEYSFCQTEYDPNYLNLVSKRYFSGGIRFNLFEELRLEIETVSSSVSAQSQESENDKSLVSSFVEDKPQGDLIIINAFTEDIGAHSKQDSANFWNPDIQCSFSDSSLTESSIMLVKAKMETTVSSPVKDKSKGALGSIKLVGRKNTKRNVNFRDRWQRIKHVVAKRDKPLVLLRKLEKSGWLKIKEIDENWDTGDEKKALKLVAFLLSQDYYLYETTLSKKTASLLLPILEAIQRDKEIDSCDSLKRTRFIFKAIIHNWPDIITASTVEALKSNLALKRYGVSEEYKIHALASVIDVLGNIVERCRPEIASQALQALELEKGFGQKTWGDEMKKHNLTKFISEHANNPECSLGFEYPFILGPAAKLDTVYFEETFLSLLRLGVVTQDNFLHIRKSLRASIEKLEKYNVFIPWGAFIRLFHKDVSNIFSRELVESENILNSTFISDIESDDLSDIILFIGLDNYNPIIFYGGTIFEVITKDIFANPSVFESYKQLAKQGTLQLRRHLLNKDYKSIKEAGYTKEEVIEAVLQHNLNSIVTQTTDLILDYQGRKGILVGLTSLKSKIDKRKFKLFKLEDFKETLSQIDMHLADSEIEKELIGLGFKLFKREEEKLILPLAFDNLLSVYRGSAEKDDEDASYLTHSITTALLHYAVKGGEFATTEGDYAFHEFDLAALIFEGRNKRRIDKAVSLAFSYSPEEPLPEYSRKRTMTLKGKTVREHLAELMKNQLKERQAKQNILKIIYLITRGNLSKEAVNKALDRMQEEIKSLRYDCNLKYEYWEYLFGYLDKDFYNELKAKYQPNQDNSNLVTSVMEKKVRDFEVVKIHQRDNKASPGKILHPWGFQNKTLLDYIEYTEQTRQGTFDKVDVSTVKEKDFQVSIGQRENEAGSGARSPNVSGEKKSPSEPASSPFLNIPEDTNMGGIDLRRMEMERED